MSSNNYFNRIELLKVVVISNNIKTGGIFNANTLINPPVIIIRPSNYLWCFTVFTFIFSTIAVLLRFSASLTGMKRPVLASLPCFLAFSIIVCVSYSPS